ncbi:MAG: synthase subunit c [Clostridia bacterium]|jgi:V/A-type H+-transporting ATPase subunit K|nr:synthase subunit c [Clostridia bacterium]
MYVLLVSAISIVILTIGAGFVLYNSKEEANSKRLGNILKGGTAVYGVLILTFLFMLIPDYVSALTEEVSGAGYAFLAAGLSTGLATIGAGYAVGAVGSSALGAVSENPKILGRTLIFVGLAEGIAIYGLIISIIILGRV